MAVDNFAMGNHYPTAGSIRCVRQTAVAFCGLEIFHLCRAVGLLSGTRWSGACGSGCGLSDRSSMCRTLARALRAGRVVVATLRCRGAAGRFWGGGSGSRSRGHGVGGGCGCRFLFGDTLFNCGCRGFLLRHGVGNGQRRSEFHRLLLGTRGGLLVRACYQQYDSGDGCGAQKSYDGRFKIWPAFLFRLYWCGTDGSG